MRLRFLLILVFCINILQSIYTPIIDDEAYYWLWSLKMDYGYFDHPPMIALWVKLSNLFFEGELGARFFTVCCNTFSVFLLWQLLNPKSKKEKIVFAIIYFSLIFVQIFSFISTPDAPLLFFTLSYLYVLRLFLGKQNLINTLLLGFCFAGLMYSKYQGILVLIFTLLPIIVYLYRKYQFYIAILFSLVLYLPHFYWLYLNNYPPIYYHFIDRNAGNQFSINETIIYILTAIICSSGLLFPFLLKGLKELNTTDLFNRSIYWLVIGPFFFFLISTFKSEVQAQWLLISYIASGLVIYWYVINQDNLRSFYVAGYITILILFLARIIIVIPSISPLYETKLFAEKLNNIPTKIVAFERYQEASVYQFYHPDHQAVVYRTLGNRNSQFMIWDSEVNLSNNFTYVSPWLRSNQFFTGFKKLNYYVSLIKDYTPIHKIQAVFLSLNNKKIDLDKELKVSNEDEFLLEVSQIDLNLIKEKDYRLALFVTKDEQYNIVDEIEIPLSVSVLKNKNIYQFKIQFNHRLPKGNYTIYIGITPKNLLPKYQSKPLKIIISE